MLTRLLAVAVLTATASAAAQSSRTLSDDDWCDDTAEWSDGETACEVRETVLSARRLSVDAGPMGGATIKAWDRPDVLVRARVVAGARTQREADRLLDATVIETQNGQIRSRQPRDVRGAHASGRWVAVSYEVFAPRRTDAAVRAVNGGVGIHGLHGALRAEAVNGGVALSDVAGAVRARTTNGGVSVTLAGDRWVGEGLDVESTNGGITLTLPDGYSADLTATTRMGRITTPGLALRDARRAEGRWTGDELTARIGNGGPRLRVATVNGGVSIRHGR